VRDRTIPPQKLGEAMDTPAKSLISAHGNPQMRSLFGVIDYLQKQASVELYGMRVSW
jgi:hypothetical protein